VWQSRSSLSAPSITSPESRSDDHDVGFELTSNVFELSIRQFLELLVLDTPVLLLSLCTALEAQAYDVADLQQLTRDELAQLLAPLRLRLLRERRVHAVFDALRALPPPIAWPAGASSAASHASVPPTLASPPSSVARSAVAEVAEEPLLSSGVGAALPRVAAPALPLVPSRACAPAPASASAVAATADALVSTPPRTPSRSVTRSSCRVSTESATGGARPRIKLPCSECAAQLRFVVPPFPNGSVQGNTCTLLLDCPRCRAALHITLRRPHPFGGGATALAQERMPLLADLVADVRVAYE
jgi:hypothetical protein